MPKYEVTIEQRIPVTVKVEAANETAAEKAAMYLLKKDNDAAAITWKWDDAEDEVLGVDEMEETDEELQRELRIPE